MRSKTISTYQNSAASIENSMATAVDKGRERDAQSIYDQIFRVINPTQQTVESKVQELQERSGLKAFLAAKKEQENVKKASVSDLQKDNPDLWNSLVDFIKNNVKAHKGLISIPSMQSNLLHVFKGSGISSDVIYDPQIAKIISDALLEEQRYSFDNKKDYLHLSRSVPISEEDDGSNSDFFHGINI